MKRIASAVLLGSAIAIIAGGCGKQSDTAVTATEGVSAAEAAGKSDTDIVLRFSWWGGDERNAATQEVIKQFEDAHPNVKIEAEFGGSDGYHDKLATQLASGTAPDIIQVDPERFPIFLKNNDYFVDLSEYDIDLSGFDAEYIGMPINGNYGGKQLGLPTGIAGGAIVVNKDVMDASGIDLTSDELSWEGLLEMGRSVRAHNPDNYLLCANKEYLTNLVVFNYGKQLCGGTFYDSDSGKLRITEDELKEVFSYVKALYDNEVVAPASYQATYPEDKIQQDANWISGKYAAALAYVSTADVMVAANPSASYTAARLPVMDGAAENGWASNTPQLLAVTKASSHPEVAAEFLNYFFNDARAQETLGTTRSVPATETARRVCEEKGILTEITRRGADIAAGTSGTPNDTISSTDEAKTILFDAVESIGYGAASVEDAAKDTYAQLKDLEM